MQLGAVMRRRESRPFVTETMQLFRRVLRLEESQRRVRWLLGIAGVVFLGAGLLQSGNAPEGSLLHTAAGWLFAASVPFAAVGAIWWARNHHHLERLWREHDKFASLDVVPLQVGERIGGLRVSEASPECLLLERTGLQRNVHLMRFVKTVSLIVVPLVLVAMLLAEEPPLQTHQWIFLGIWPVFAFWYMWQPWPVCWSIRRTGNTIEILAEELRLGLLRHSVRLGASDPVRVHSEPSCVRLVCETIDEATNRVGRVEVYLAVIEKDFLPWRLRRLAFAVQTHLKPTSPFAEAQSALGQTNSRPK